MSSDIRSFSVSIFRVCILSALMLGVVFFGIRPDLDNYFAGSLLQIELLEKTQGPRIILAGGSNVSFGLDAELMQKKLGAQVINFGLHAGLGIVPLRELQQYIHEGDVIVLSLEYSMFSNTKAMHGEAAFLSDWIEVAPSRVRYLSNPITETPIVYTVMLQRKVNRSIEYVLAGGSLVEVRDIFNSNYFNANGDFTGHLNEPSLAIKKIPFDAFPVQPLQDDLFDFLEQYNRQIHALGATLYFEAPASRQGNCDTTGAADIENFFNIYGSKSSIPLLTPLDKICMADKYFFDTPYHLNVEGRRIRTLRLIDDLFKALGRNN